MVFMESFPDRPIPVIARIFGVDGETGCRAKDLDGRRAPTARRLLGLPGCSGVRVFGLFGCRVMA
jgi:hypothetical protein